MNTTHQEFIIYLKSIDPYFQDKSGILNKSLEYFWNTCNEPSWMIWMLRTNNLLSKEIAVKLSIQFAASVIHLANPLSSTPRANVQLAISVARKWLNDQSTDNRMLCYDAAVDARNVGYRYAAIAAPAYGMANSGDNDYGVWISNDYVYSRAGKRAGANGDAEYASPETATAAYVSFAAAYAAFTASYSLYSKPDTATVAVAEYVDKSLIAYASTAPNYARHIACSDINKTKKAEKIKMANANFVRELFPTNTIINLFK